MKNTIEPLLIEQQVIYTITMDDSGILNSNLKAWEPDVLVAMAPKHFISLIYTDREKYNSIALNEIIQYQEGNPTATFHQLFGNRVLENLRSSLYSEYHQLLLQNYSIQAEIYFQYEVDETNIIYFVRSISKIN